MSALYDSLMRFAAPEQLLRDEPMAAHTTFRIGGPADWMFFPESEGRSWPRWTRRGRWASRCWCWATDRT